MSPELYQYLPFIVGGAILLVIAIFIIMRMSRRASVIRDESSGKDVLDEGAARAARNQALIDSPEAVEKSFGQESANANSDQIAAAGASADAEAGAHVAPTVTPDAGPADDLTRIKGLGPKIAGILRDEGVTTFAQIAAWSESDVERMDMALGRFSGRITRDQWVEQAKLLESGNESGFEDKFGRT